MQSVAVIGSFVTAAATACSSGFSLPETREPEASTFNHSLKKITACQNISHRAIREGSRINPAKVQTLSHTVIDSCYRRLNLVLQEPPGIVVIYRTIETLRNPHTDTHKRITYFCYYRILQG